MWLPLVKGPSPPRQHQCPGCDRSYKHKGNLNRHMREECGQDEPATCAACNKTFRYKRTLYEHIKNECGLDLSFQCTNCSKTFCHKTTLQKHIVYDCGKEPQFECPVPFCNFKTKRKNRLSKHMTRPHVHPDDVKKCTSNTGHEVGPFQCPNCGKEYKHERTFTHHFKNDCGKGKQYNCTTCNRIYKHKTALWTHMTYECGKEPQFKCPRCPYSAKRKSTLKDHMNIHVSHPLEEYALPGDEDRMGDTGEVCYFDEEGNQIRGGQEYQGYLIEEEHDYEGHFIKTEPDYQDDSPKEDDEIHGHVACNVEVEEVNEFNFENVQIKIENTDE